MKKIKSLLSLMLVMMFMLSMAGPMAFADAPTGTTVDDPFVVTIKANAPYFHGDKYIAASVTTDPAGLPLVEGTHYEVIVSDNGASVTATPVAINDGDNVIFCESVERYYKINFQSYTIDKPVISMTASVPTLDLTTGEYSSVYQHVGGTLDSSESFVFAKQPVVTYSEATGKATASVSESDIKIMNGGTDVTAKYDLDIEGSEAQIATTKTTIKVEADAPVYSDLQYKSNGLKQGTFEIKVGDTIPTVNVHCTLKVVDNGSTVTVTPENVTVKTADAVMTDLTEYVNIEIVPYVYNKPTVNVYANTPVLNSTETAYVENGARIIFENDDLKSAYLAKTSVRVNVSGKTATIADVVILNGSNQNVTNYFNVITHAAAVDGGVAGDNNNNNNGGTTTPVVPTNKTKLVIQAIDAEKAYNGYSFSSAQARGVKYAEGTSLLSGHKLNAEILKIQYTRRSDGVTFNDYTDVYKVGTYDKKLIIPANNVILDANNNDVTSQYDITALNGILTIYNAGWVSPDTGDHSNIVLWIVLLAASAVAAAAVVFIVLKKSKKA